MMNKKMTDWCLRKIIVGLRELLMKKTLLDAKRRLSILGKEKLEDNSIQDKGKQKAPGEFFFAAFLMIITLLLLIESLKLEGIFQNKFSSAGSMPQTLSIIVLLLFSLIIFDLKKEKYINGNLKDTLYFIFTKKTVQLLSCIIAYGVLLSFLGFEIATLLFLIVTMYVIEKKDLKSKILISLAILVSLVIIFKFIFQLILP